jgi:ferredoxin
MKVTIDESKCNGAGICVQELPQVFRFQEGSKKGMVQQGDVPATLERRLLKVAADCPTGAITILNK